MLRPKRPATTTRKPSPLRALSARPTLATVPETSPNAAARRAPPPNVNLGVASVQAADGGPLPLPLSPAPVPALALSSPPPKAQRTSKTSTKLVNLPSEPQTRAELDEGREVAAAAAPEDETLVTRKGRTDRKSAGERMSKAERGKVGFPYRRLVAYCVAEGLKMKLLAAFLRREHNVTVRVFDEAVYVMYHLPLLPGYHPDVNVRSSAPATPKPGTKSFLARLSEAEENGYQGTYFSQRGDGGGDRDRGGGTDRVGMSVGPGKGDGGVAGAARGGGGPHGYTDGYISSSPEDTRRLHPHPSQHPLYMPQMDAYTSQLRDTVVSAIAVREEVEEGMLVDLSDGGGNGITGDSVLGVGADAGVVNGISATAAGLLEQSSSEGLFQQSRTPRTPHTPSEEGRPRAPSISDDQMADVVFFEYGVVVFFGLSESEEHAIIDDLASARILSRKFEESDWEVEECHYTYDLNAVYPRIYNDLFTFKSPSHLLKLSIAHALAQSTLLARYEEAAAAVLADPATNAIPLSLAQTGGIRLRRRDALRLTGRLFRLRTDVNLVSNVLDKPEFFWSEASLRDLYDAVREYMEIGPRVQVLNEKLAVASDLLDLIHNHLNGSAMERITWIIIWLIAVACFVEVGEVLARLVVKATTMNRNAGTGTGATGTLASAAAVVAAHVPAMTKEEALVALEKLIQSASASAGVLVQDAGRVL